MSTPIIRAEGLTKVVVSGEAPGRLGSRLRDLARDPLLEGKILSVYSLSGPLRPDLPASLLAEGNLCAVGAAGSIGIGLPRILDELAQMAEVAAASDGKTLRPEDLPGPVVWFY